MNETNENSNDTLTIYDWTTKVERIITDKTTDN